MNEPTAGTFAKVDLLTAAHRGGLTPSEVGRGVLAAHRNARRLLLDALCLFEHGRSASALVMTILANEEGGKTLAISLAGVCERELPPTDAHQAWSPLRQSWRDFKDHDGKNEATLGLHSLVGDFPPEAREGLAAIDVGSVAAGYGTMRERATYVDCVQGAERWSLPEAIVDGEAALTMLQATRKALGRIITPATAAEVVAKAESVVPLSSHERRQAMLDWSASAEAAELSKIDLAEVMEWSKQMDAALARAEQAARTPRE